jgi:hypothetical protein
VDSHELDLKVEQKTMAMTMDGKNRIMIYDQKDDGTYVVEFKTAAGQAMAIFRGRRKK